MLPRWYLSHTLRDVNQKIRIEGLEGLIMNGIPGFIVNLLATGLVMGIISLVVWLVSHGVYFISKVIWRDPPEDEKEGKKREKIYIMVVSGIIVLLVILFFVAMIN